MRIPFVVAKAVAASVLCMDAVAGPIVIWQLGTPDRHYKEFAISGNYGAFREQFVRDPVVDVTSPDPARHWPFIHPGPADAWAGSRPHTFRIRFLLREVAGPACRLTIGLVDTHHHAPPTVVVNINGRTKYRYDMPAGGPDASLVNPTHGKPAAVVIPFPSSFLRKGMNTLDLAVVSGSWMLYDHVTLDGGLDGPTGPVLTGLKAGSTMLFRRVNGRLRQIVEVNVINDGIEGDVVASLSGSDEMPCRVTLMPGINRFELPIAPVAQARDAEVILSARAAAVRTPVRLTPERRWTVYVAPSSHTDIGYTDFQERAVAVHLNNTVAALKAVRTVPAFRWNLEVAYHAELLRQFRPELSQSLERAIASGRIGLQGLYLNMLTGLCSSEEMVRVLSPATAYRSLGRDIASTASLNDVPSAIGTMPTMLRHAGYRYFTDAVNEYRGPLFRDADPRMKQSPFWWEGPDGSRILTILTHGYSQASGIGLNDGVQQVAQRLPGWLRGFDRPDYPGNAVLAYGGVSDNMAMKPDYARVAAEWNRTYAFPRIVVGAASEFFRHIEREHAHALPVFKGDLGVYWEDGAGSSAHETAITRHARARLSSAQRILALMGSSYYPKADMDEAWRQVMFYNEHTWGAWCSVTEPDSEQTREQWVRKAAFAYEARRQSEALVSRLGSRQPITAPTTVRVWNAMAWTRDIMVTAPLRTREGGSLSVTAMADRAPVPSQVETHGGDRLVFLARSVPPLGYADYRISPGGNMAAPLMQPGNEPGEWLSPTIRLKLDTVSGAVLSLQERASEREWARMHDGIGMNQFLYVLGGEGSSVIGQGRPEAKLDVRTHTRSEIKLVENGPVRSILHVARHGDGVPYVETWVIVDAAGRVHFRNIVHKDATTAKEAAYFAFPGMFRAAGSRAFVDVAMGYVEAERGQLPGACRDWYALTTHAALSDDERTVVIAMPHSPLVTFGDVFRGRWQSKVEPNGVAFAYLLNNYWDTNYCARQSGPLTFSFSLDLVSGPYDPVRAARFGQEAALAAPDPQMVRLGGSVLDGSELVVSDPVQPGPYHTLSITGAELVGIERRNDTLIARLLNLQDTPIRAVVTATPGRIARALRTNLVGEGATPLSLEGDGSVAVDLDARAPATIRLVVADERLPGRRTVRSD